MALCTACRLVPQTNAVLASYTMSRNGLSSTIAHNFAKDITTLSATKKLASGQVVKGVYGMKDKTALVELAQAPFTARDRFTFYPFSSQRMQVACDTCMAAAHAQSTAQHSLAQSELKSAPAVPHTLRLEALQLVSQLLLPVLQLSVRTKLLGNKPSKPTLGFTISRDVEYNQVHPYCFLHSRHASASKAVFF